MKRILIIEDDRQVSALLHMVISGQGYAVERAYDGLEGIGKVESFRPDLILLDVNLPGMDGWNLLRGLKSSPKTKGIPVVMCTEHNLMGEIEQAGAMGADGYVTKPFDPERVIRKIRGLLGTEPPALDKRPTTL